MKTIGVIGLGLIGSIWAKHYHAAAILAGTWNRTPQPDSPKWLQSPEAVATAADLIQIVVADPPAVRGILERILPELGPTKTIIQSSTIDPQSSDEFLRLVTASGARYLEAPFTGSKPAAEQKKNVYYLGGDKPLVDEILPTLSLVSEFQFHIGTHQQAAAMKLAMNLNVAALMQALSEALVFVRRAGISDDAFFSVLSKNVGYSGLVKLKEPKLRNNDFAPQFSIKHLLKDIRLASQTNGCDDFPLLDTLRDQLHAAAEAGYADEDFSALVKLL